MNYLKMIKKCAEKMGYSGWQSKHGYWNVKDPEGKDHVCCNGWSKFDPWTGEKLPKPTFNNALSEIGYNPLHDDAQAMALVKKFQLAMHTFEGKEGREWCVNFPFTKVSDFRGYHTYNKDLNRAICECVAKLP